MTRTITDRPRGRLRSNPEKADGENRTVSRWHRGSPVGVGLRPGQGRHRPRSRWPHRRARSGAETDPASPDSDGDGWSDFDEVLNQTTSATDPAASKPPTRISTASATRWKHNSVPRRARSTATTTASATSWRIGRPVTGRPAAERPARRPDGQDLQPGDGRSTGAGCGQVAVSPMNSPVNCPIPT